MLPSARGRGRLPAGTEGEELWCAVDRNPRDRAMRFLVVTQVALLVMALFAPIPVRAADPSQSPAPSAEPSATSSPDPSADPTSTPTAEPSAAPDRRADGRSDTGADAGADRRADCRADGPDARRDRYPRPDARTRRVHRVHRHVRPGHHARRPRPAPSPLPGPTSPIRSPPLRLAFISVPTGSSVVVDLRSDGNVSSVELDRVRTAEAAPSDTEYADQWSLPKIGWDQVYGTVAPSGSAVVALLDTGVDGASGRPRRPARRRDQHPRWLRRNDRPERPRHGHGRASSRP